MTDILVTLSSGTGREGFVRHLLNHEWEHVFVVTTAAIAQDFSCNKPCTFIIVDENQKLPHMRSAVQTQMGHVNGVEIALNLSAGTGKMAMASLSAIMRAGLGLRLVSYTKEDGVQEV